MKHFITVVPLILFLLLTYCKSPSHERNSDEDRLIAELNSTWSQVISDSLKLNDENSNIKSVRLINDSIAEVQIINSSGERKITGKWKFKINKKKELDIEIKSDIDRVDIQTSNNPYKILVKYGDEKEKTVMLPIVFIK